MTDVEMAQDEVMSFIRFDALGIHPLNLELGLCWPHVRERSV